MGERRGVRAPGRPAEGRRSGHHGPRLCPGRSWQGKVDYLYPTLMPPPVPQGAAALRQPGRVLKPNMFAKVSIRTGQGNPAMVVPSEAVIRTGSQDRLVLALGMAASNRSPSLWVPSLATRSPSKKELKRGQHRPLGPVPARLRIGHRFGLPAHDGGAPRPGMDPGRG